MFPLLEFPLLGLEVFPALEVGERRSPLLSFPLLDFFLMWSPCSFAKAVGDPWNRLQPEPTTQLRS